jgi:hypothetical protein
MTLTKRNIAILLAVILVSVWAGMELRRFLDIDRC